MAGDERRVDVIQVEASGVAVWVSVAGMRDHHLVVWPSGGSVVGLSAGVRVNRFPPGFLRRRRRFGFGR